MKLGIPTNMSRYYFFHQVWVKSVEKVELIGIKI